MSVRKHSRFIAAFGRKAESDGLESTYRNGFSCPNKRSHLSQLIHAKLPQSVLYLHRYENKAIVSARVTNEYCRYLFERPVCTRRKRVLQDGLPDLPDSHLPWHLQHLPQDTYATAPKPPCSTTSSMSTGLSSRPNWPATANTCPLSSAGNLMST